MYHGSASRSCPAVYALLADIVWRGGESTCASLWVDHLDCQVLIEVLHDASILAHNRLYKASKEVILYSGIAHAVMAAWGLLLRASAGSQPIVACAVIGAGANIYKLQQIFPPGPRGSSSENSGR